MTSSIHSFTIDPPDPYALATWWSQVVGAPLSEEDHPGDPEAMVALPAGPPLLFATLVDDQRRPDGTEHRLMTEWWLRRLDGPPQPAEPTTRSWWSGAPGRRMAG